MNTLQTVRTNSNSPSPYAKYVVARRSILHGKPWALILALTLLAALPAFAQSDPWSNAATRLATVFTGPIAKGFTLVAIVLGGFSLAYSEGGGKRAVGGLIFGGGLSMGAVQVLTWLFS